jgi:hypothetical protein
MCRSQSIALQPASPGESLEGSLMKYPVRDDPRISLSKLAEYAVASAARRRTLLQDQRYPSSFKAAPYSEAYAAFAEALIDGGNPADVDAYIDEWRSRKPASRFQSKASALCIAAATAFKKLLADGALAGLTFEDGLREAYIDVGGVQVSVRPDVIVTGPAGGAVKIYLCKGSALTRDEDGRFGSGSYAAALVHQWVGTWLGDASPKTCLVVDVFAGAVHRAPVHFVKRRKDLVASCKEISKLWSSIEGPAGTTSSSSSPF